MGAIDTAGNIAICNQALGLLGANQIELNGSDLNHTYCETFFEDARDEISACHPWNYCTIRDYAIQTTDPKFGHDNAYTKPSDCIKVWQLEEPDDEYKVEGDLILTDEGKTPPDWEEDTQYEVDDIVTNDDITYQCLVAHYSSNADTEPGVGSSTDTYWKNFVTDDGTMPDDWATSTAYTADDLVLNDNTIYQCAVDHTSSADDEPGTGDNYTDYWIEPLQNNLYLPIIYAYQVTDLSICQPYVKQCMAYNLAIKLCSPIKQNETVALNLQSMLYGGRNVTGMLALARSSDAQEGTGHVIKTQTWLDARL